MKITVDFVQGIDALAPGLSRAQQPLLGALRRIVDIEVRPVRLPVMTRRMLFPLIYGPLPITLLARRAQVTHLPNSWYAHLVPVLRSPVIVTCHDLIEGDEIRRGERKVKPHRRWHQRAVWRGLTTAQYIVCDSKAVAAQLFARGVASERVRVIPLGIDAQFSPGEVNLDRLRQLGVHQPFVLYVGSEQPRKNLQRLIPALARARGRRPSSAVPASLTWVKVGDHQSTSGRAALNDAVSRHDMGPATTMLNDVDDNDLINLYRGAAVTVLLSLHEGFGFPPLEAMACGCPALVSRRDCLVEVTGGAALTVDPLDEEAIAAAIEAAVFDETLRQSLIQRGLQRAQALTWRNTALAYAELYREASGSR
jgi:glycosyltransferase involved in cell wall biosynthesis